MGEAHQRHRQAEGPKRRRHHSEGGGLRKPGDERGNIRRQASLPESETERSIDGGVGDGVAGSRPDATREPNADWPDAESGYPETSLSETYPASVSTNVTGLARITAKRRAGEVTE